MLFNTKAITRLGKRADGTTVSDFDDEEKKRQYSIKTSVIPVEYKGSKINVLDNPGYFDFAAEVVQSLRVADAGLICLSAKSGIVVGTEKGWKSLADANLPAMFYVSKLDEEHANYFRRPRRPAGYLRRQRRSPVLPHSPWRRGRRRCRRADQEGV